MFVGRPSSNRQYIFLMVNISKAGILHPAFEERTGTRLHISFAHGVDEFVIELQ